MKYVLLFLLCIAFSCSKKTDTPQPSYLGQYNVEFTEIKTITGSDPVTTKGVNKISILAGSDASHLVLTDGKDSEIITLNGDNFSFPPYTSSTDPKATSTSSGKFTATGFTYSRTVTSPGDGFTQLLTAIGTKQ